MIPVSQPSLTGLERRYVADAVESSWVSSTGPYLDRFESEFADFTGTSHALAVANGTVALHLTLLGLGVGPGDEVIVPSLTYIATANAVSYVGATPVFADVESRSWGLDPDSVKGMISDRTRAIIAVHLYGRVCDMSALRSLADTHSLFLIEDAAEAPGATYMGKSAGSLGDVATFSFYGNKILTSGEGGAVTTSDDELADKMRLIRGQGMDPHRRYYFPVIGHNFRLTNVAAAMLCAQLERYDEIIRERRRIFSAYRAHLGGLPRLEVQTELAGQQESPWLFCVLLDPADRDHVADGLRERGVDSRPFFIPLHTMPPYRNSTTSTMAVTMDLSGRGLNLPTFPDLDDEAITRIGDLLSEVI